MMGRILNSSLQWPRRRLAVNRGPLSARKCFASGLYSHGKHIPTAPRSLARTRDRRAQSESESWRDKTQALYVQVIVDHLERHQPTTHPTNLNRKRKKTPPMDSEALALLDVPAARLTGHSRKWRRMDPP